jgi:hypothetical protein
MSVLHEGSIEDFFRVILKKQQDPNRPELDGQPVEPGPAGQPSQPRRSGVQDTPLKQRHRKYFNAYSNQPATDKLGYPDQGWSDIRSYNPSNKRLRPYRLFSHH